MKHAVYISTLLFLADLSRAPKVLQGVTSRPIIVIQKNKTKRAASTSYQASKSLGDNILWIIRPQHPTWRENPKDKRCSRVLKENLIQSRETSGTKFIHLKKRWEPIIKLDILTHQQGCSRHAVFFFFWGGGKSHIFWNSRFAHSDYYFNRFHHIYNVCLELGSDQLFVYREIYR